VVLNCHSSQTRLHTIIFDISVGNRLGDEESNL